MGKVGKGDYTRAQENKKERIENTSLKNTEELTL
jgi:hypothetical protein